MWTAFPQRRTPLLWVPRGAPKRKRKSSFLDVDCCWSPRGVIWRRLSRWTAAETQWKTGAADSSGTAPNSDLWKKLDVRQINQKSYQDNIAQLIDIIIRHICVQIIHNMLILIKTLNFHIVLKKLILYRFQQYILTSTYVLVKICQRIADIETWD